MDEEISRRRFLSRISLGLTAIAGAVVSVPIVAYLLSPLLQPPSDVWLDVGPVDSFQVGKTVQVAIEDPSPLPWAGQTAKTAIYVRRVTDQQFTVFAVNCTHLGCPVNWRDGANLFMCPCHGGVYYADGTVAGGPPPLPLPTYQWRITNGTVQVLTQPIPLSQG